uniref:Fork-head domain-containing protein n=1 Tax=Acrobeloides nanus TaxID=290746 RepID=A0A914DWC0_9BILA
MHSNKRFQREKRGSRDSGSAGGSAPVLIVRIVHPSQIVRKQKIKKYNAIRHNLSLHKQFYKVLREGHRSCLWAVDKSRIIKGEKTKKAAPILPPSFRQRSQTDPISMKAVKNFISENSGKKTEAKFYDPLISQINSISSGNSSVEILPQDPIINDSYSSPSSNSSSGLSWNYEQANKNAYVPNIQSWNYEQPQNDYTPNYDCFTVSPSTMELDYQAIIEHERHLYEADYPRY